MMILEDKSRKELRAHLNTLFDRYNEFEVFDEVDSQFIRELMKRHPQQRYNAYTTGDNEISWKMNSNGRSLYLQDGDKAIRVSAIPCIYSFHPRQILNHKRRERGITAAMEKTMDPKELHRINNEIKAELKNQAA